MYQRAGAVQAEENNAMLGNLNNVKAAAAGGKAPNLLNQGSKRRCVGGTHTLNRGSLRPGPGPAPRPTPWG